MPYDSKKQAAFMHIHHPQIAARWDAEAKRKGTPAIQAADLDLYRKQIADAYREMGKPAEKKYGDVNLSSGGQFGNSGSGDVEAAPAPVVAPPPMMGGGQEVPPPAPQQNFSPAVVSSEAPPVSQDPLSSVDEGKVSKADLVKPETSKTEKGEGGVSAAGYDRSLVAPARAVTVAAHETPTLDPGRIAQLSADQQAIIGAQQDIGAAQDQAARASADAAQQRADLMAQQQADMQRQAQEHDAYLRRQEDQIAGLSKEVADEKIDPFKNKTTLDRIRYGLAAALGGFVSGFRGTPNYAMQQINTELDREMQIQREEIERKKGRIGDQQGLLASAYRRFGNLDQAEAAARGVALQQLDAEQQAYAARNGDPVQLAKSKMLSKQMQLDADKFKASLFQYQPARTGTTGGLSAAQVKSIGELAGKIRSEAATNGHDVAPEEARRQAMATLGFTAGTGYADISKPQKGAGNVSQKDAESIRAHENALENLNQLIEMRKANNGGSFSPTDKRVAHALAARAQEDLVAALGKTNQGLLDRTAALIPDDPLEHNISGVIGSDPTLAGMESARAQLQSELGRIQKTPGTPGSAGDTVAVTPEAEEE